MVTKNYLIDMDGVLIKGKNIIPGADKFIDQLNALNIKFLVLTNNSMYTPGDLAHRLKSMGINITKEQIFTSALATARFLQSQKPNGKAYVIGESGLTEAIHDAGYILTNIDPDYMVLGETFAYNFEQIKIAVRLVMQGAHFIATNPDVNGPSDGGIVPACGAMAALIEKASGKSPFFIGKPNPVMIRSAINYLGVHSENTVMIGDRMDTDILAGIQSGLETFLVLSGVTSIDEVPDYPYQPRSIAQSISEIEL
ncbi:MAG TPA: HAD-IIA family hydrolase [Anaerolineaceae bacterium]|nr:HAD-IIA family hydrolase [Anaerolineaceae bacterium]